MIVPNWDQIQCWSPKIRNGQQDIEWISPDSDRVPGNRKKKMDSSKTIGSRKGTWRNIQNTDMEKEKLATRRKRFKKAHRKIASPFISHQERGKRKAKCKSSVFFLFFFFSVSFEIVQSFRKLEFYVYHMSLLILEHQIYICILSLVCKNLLALLFFQTLLVKYCTYYQYI